MCDPDCINQWLYNWLDYREKLALEHKRTYTYAATYESFMEMIEKCEDLEHLKQMRYNIISEIMQATAIQHLKRLKGEDIGELQRCPSAPSWIHQSYRKMSRNFNIQISDFLRERKRDIFGDQMSVMWWNACDAISFLTRYQLPIVISVTLNIVIWNKKL